MSTPSKNAAAKAHAEAVARQDAADAQRRENMIAEHRRIQASRAISTPKPKLSPSRAALVARIKAAEDAIAARNAAAKKAAKH